MADEDGPAVRAVVVAHVLFEVDEQGGVGVELALQGAAGDLLVQRVEAEQGRRVVEAADIQLGPGGLKGQAAALGPDQPGFADVLDLVGSGKAYVKISGGYRASKAAPDYADAIALAKALIAANPDRIVWGTDWPHPDSVTPPGRKPTDVTPLFQIDDGRLLNQLPVWAPDAAIREKILVANPARLYGFEGRRA